MTAADHENTIRNGLLPKDAHHKFCNTRRDIGKDCDCYYSLRRDGKAAHDALDALLSEHAAELARAHEQIRILDGLLADRDPDPVEKWAERLQRDLMDSGRREDELERRQEEIIAAQEPPAEPTGLHLDPCACGHDHAAGREGTCGSFLCGCRKWEPPVDRGDR